ncbi:MAG: rod shape-determining protein MreC [Clostridia bacterium]|nr:rod shape-determining protein MreC [Clostridia bacterium]
MRSFFKSTRFKGFLGFFGVLILSIVIAAATESGSSPASTVLGTVFSPLQSVSSAIADSVKDFSVYFRSSAQYQQRVKELENQLGEAQKELVGYEQAKQQIALYEEFLELKEENEDFQFASASVIGSDSSDAFGSFTLNKGELDGVKVNNPVIYGKYLVGVVVKTAPTYCVVNTVLNPEVNVSAYEVRTRESGYSTTTVDLAKEGKCCLSGLVRTTAIAPGGIVCTSGVGGIYPADLIVGTVEEVKNDTTNISSYAVINTQVDFTQLRDVFIITQFKGMGVGDVN